MDVVYFLVIGAIAGLLAGQLMKGRGFGLVGNIVVGVVGGVVGGYIFDLLDIAPDGSQFGAFVTALVGAVVLLALVGVFKKA